MVAAPKFPGSFNFATDFFWVLAGNSVHFNRGFLRRDMPSFEGLLGHRHLDVSSHLITARAYGSNPMKLPPAHRALADVGQSVQTYAEFVVHNMLLADGSVDRWQRVRTEVEKLGKSAGAASGAV
jgi:hypothetical protein